MSFDLKPRAGSAPADPASQDPSGSAPSLGPPMRGRQWRTTEVALLRQHYGASGAAAVHALLPHRSLSAIRGKAAALGIAGCKGQTAGFTFTRKYAKRPDIDNAIREGYIHAKAKGDVLRLAERLGRPAWWVQKRAASLGLTRTNTTRLDAWTAAELRILEAAAACDLNVIRGKLKAAGFRRTCTAIAVKLKRLRLDRTDPDRWSATALAPLFGRDPATVADWVARRGLLATRSGSGPTVKMLIHRRDLRRWIERNPQFVDLRRVDQVFFWDVMFGGRAS
jgi:hypothetical protein